MRLMEKYNKNILKDMEPVEVDEIIRERTETIRKIINDKVKNDKDALQNHVVKISKEDFTK